MFGERAVVKRVGTYALTRLLGEGATSAVYEATDSVRPRQVALKVMKKSYANGPDSAAREFRVGARLRHPNTVRYHSLFSAEDRYGIAMELVTGVDLLSYVWRKDPGASGHGAVDIARLRQVLAQLCTTLCWLHDADVIHCDIKPSNILVTPQERVVLLDFGLAISPHRVHSRGCAGDVWGTPAYMPPEQLKCDHALPAWDWYAIGAMVFHAFVGRPPLGSTPSLAEICSCGRDGSTLAPANFVADVPGDLNALCRDLLCVDLHERPSGPEVLARLAHPEYDRRR